MAGISNVVAARQEGMRSKALVIDWSSPCSQSFGDLRHQGEGMKVRSWFDSSLSTNSIKRFFVPLRLRVIGLRPRLWSRANESLDMYP